MIHGTNDCFLTREESVQQAEDFKSLMKEKTFNGFLVRKARLESPKIFKAVGDLSIDIGESIHYNWKMNSMDKSEH